MTRFPGSASRRLRATGSGLAAPGSGGELGRGMHTIGSVEHSHAPVAPRQDGLNRGVQADFSGWVRATSDPTELELGEAGFTYPDLFDPARLAALTDRFDAYFLDADPEAFARFAAYRKTGGQGVPPEQ